MKIKALVNIQMNEHEIYRAGEIFDCPKDKAEYLIKRFYAKEVPETPKKTEVVNIEKAEKTAVIEK